MDPYVRLSLFDPTSGGTEAFRSTTQMNDASPRCTLRPLKQIASNAHKVLRSCRTYAWACCTAQGHRAHEMCTLTHFLRWRCAAQVEREVRLHQRPSPVVPYGDHL